MNPYIALGPKPRSYKYTVNKKEKRLAIESVLSSKLLEKELTVVNEIKLKEIKTKEMQKALSWGWNPDRRWQCR